MSFLMDIYHLLITLVVPFFFSHDSERLYTLTCIVYAIDNEYSTVGFHFKASGVHCEEGLSVACYK